MGRGIGMFLLFFSLFFHWNECEMMLMIGSQHADYVFGWRGDSLDFAMETGCAGADCPAMATQTMQPAGACEVPELVGENYSGCEYLLLIFGARPVANEI